MERMDIGDQGRASQANLIYSGDEDSGFGMSVDEIQRRMQGLVELAIAERKLLGLPVVRYDEATKAVYLEAPDGRRMDIDDQDRAFQPDPTYSGDEDSGFGMSDDEMDRRMWGLVELAIAKRKLLGLPVVRYDEATGTVYLEAPDGSRTPWP